MKIALRTSIFLSLSILGGCSWLPGSDLFFNDSEYDYTKAKMTAELVVPESVGETNVQDLYFIPELDDEVKGIVYGVDTNIMAPMQVLTLGNKARANDKSEFSSAYVTMSRDKLWSSVEKYITSENFPIKTKDPDKGLIITDWFVKEDDSFWSGDITAWRYRYKITVGDAIRPNENTLTVELLEAQELVDDTGRWQNQVDTSRTQTEQLNSILGYMYVENITKSRQLVNQSGLAGITVTLGSDSKGNPALITAANFEHVWTRLPISLRLLKVTIDDQDRSQGLFFITNDAEEEGFFASLAFWSDDGGDSLELPDTAYQIKVASKGQNTSITFIDHDNNPLKAKVLADNFTVLSKALRSRVADH